MILTRAAAAAIVSLCLVLAAPTAAAQPAGPYVVGHLGASAGDGGAAMTGGGAVGYMTARRLGFEVELNLAAGLDLDDRGRLPATPTSVLFPLPRPSFDSTGRLLTFQTNIVAALTPSGRLHVSIVGGGGVANLREDVLLQYPQIVFPDFTLIDGFSVELPGMLRTPEFRILEQRFSRSENALSLNTGGIVEYAWGANLGIGIDARYTQAFFSRDGLNLARVAARATWRF